MDRPWAGTVGTLACWAYAAVWAAFWWFSDAMPAVLTVIEPIVGQRSHSVIPAGMAGLGFFGCAPFAREGDGIKRIFYAIAIVALIAPGLWQAVTSRVGAGDMALWLVIPLVIALWVLQGGKTLFWSGVTAD